MNKVIIIGRLTRDPETRYSQGEKATAVARFTLAVDRISEGADFISCVAFGKQADFAQKYLTKGMKIALEGRIQTGSYAKNDGTKVYTTDIIVERCEFCEGRKKEDSQPEPEGFMTDIGEELPFR